MNAIIQYVSTENRPDYQEMRDFIEKFTIENQMQKINDMLD